MKPVSALFSSPHTQWQSHRASAAEQTCVSTLTLQLIASVPSTQPKWSHSDFFLFKKTNKKNALKLSGWSSWGGKSSTTSSDSRDRQQLLHLHFYLTKKYLKTHVWARFTYHDFVWGSKRKRRKRKREEKGVKNRASRVVPNGVDATTAEWEGGALRFIYAGQEDQLLCAEGGKKTKHFTTAIWKCCFKHSLLVCLPHSNMQMITVKTPTVALYSQVNIAWHPLFVDVSEEEVQCDGGLFLPLSLGNFIWIAPTKHVY